MRTFLHKLSSWYQNKLTYQQDSKNIEKLSRWSVLFIILLDIFVYSSIQLGIEFQTATLNSPETKFTYQCRNIAKTTHSIKDPLWYPYHNTFKNTSRKENYIYRNGTTETAKQVIRSIANKELDNRCTQINEYLQTITATKELATIAPSIKKLQNALSTYTKDLTYIQNNYNTVLFEKIATQPTNASILEMDLDTQNVKIKYDALQQKIATTKQQIQALKEQFATHAHVTEFLTYVEKNGKDILESYEKEIGRYYLKKTAIIILFLLPIALLFYWQMHIQNTKRNYTKYIIAKNIFSIAMLFLLINTFTLLYNFIPHLFLEKVLMFFYTLEIPFIAYYALLALGVGVLGFIIVKIQNSTKNKKKTAITFIENYQRNQCDKCGIKVDFKEMNYCPNCSNALKDTCPHCERLTIAKFDHCSFCGKKRI